MTRLIGIDPAGGGKQSVAGVSWWLGSELVAFARVFRHEASGLICAEFDRMGWDGGVGPRAWFATDWLAWRAIVRGWPRVFEQGESARRIASGEETCFDCGYRKLTAPAVVRIGPRSVEVVVVRGMIGDDQAPHIGPGAIVMERGQGAQARSVDMLAWWRGYISALGHEAGVGRISEIVSATWRGVVGRHFGLTFPRASASAKSMSLSLAARLAGRDAPLAASWDDGAEAVLIGLAGLKLGLA